MKKIFKKISASLLVQTMLFGAMTMPIQATWPDEGYVYAPSEDKVFTTCQEAVDYANAHGWDMYYKYGKKVEFGVNYNMDGTYTLSWYVYGLETPVVPVPEPVSTPEPEPVPTPEPEPVYTTEEEAFTVGYSYLASEDIAFATSYEAYDYCNAHGWDMYYKYGKPMKFYVVYQGGQFVAHWYVKK